MFRHLLLASTLTPLLFSSVAGQAAAIVYTISGYGSFQEPGGTNTGGQWSFCFTGDTANGDYQSPLPGTLTLTPYSSAVPGFSGPLHYSTLLELVTSSTPAYLFAFTLPSVILSIQLSGSSLPTSLGSPFDVTIPRADVSIPTDWIYVGDGTRYANIQVVTSDVAFSGALGALAAPEFSTWAMMGLGFAGLALVGYRKSAGELRRLA